MTPDLQSSLLCDDVRREINGKFILIGLFDVLNAPAYPLLFQRFCVVNRWCSGEGEFKERTRIMDSQKNAVLAQGREIVMRLPNSEATVTNIEYFINIVFPVAGTYWIEILIDGDLRLRYPLRAQLIQQPRQPRPDSGEPPAGPQDGKPT